ncbi:hypothetical protein ACVJGD_008023 [Bradyrhizobium sp. USDA 10063]
MFDGVARRSEADWTRTPNGAVAASQLRGRQSQSSSADDVIKAEEEPAGDAWSHRSVRACERCEAGDQVWHQRKLGRRTRQSTPILERVVSHVTITDPHHFLLGPRLEVLKERSGRGPAYVVVALPDGRRRGVRIASTDLAETSIASRPNAADLPRISVRTLIPLMQHLGASLNLLDEKVIRDAPPTASRSRCVSTPADVGKSTRPSDGRHSAPVAESVDRDANPDRSNPRHTAAANASGSRRARKGTGSC